MRKDVKIVILFNLAVWIILSVWAYYFVYPISTDMLCRYAPMAEYFAQGDFRMAFHPRFCVQFPVLAGTVVWLTGMTGMKACQMVSVAYFCLAILPIWWLADRIAGRLAALLAVALYLFDIDLVMLAIDGWRDDGKILPLVLAAISFVRLLEGGKDRQSPMDGIGMSVALLLLTTIRSDCFPVACVFLLAYAVLAIWYRRWSAVVWATAGWFLATMAQCAMVYAYEGWWVPSAQVLRVIEHYL